MSVVPEVATTPSPRSPKRRTGYRVWGEVSLVVLFIWGISLLAVRIGERRWIAERHDAGTNGAPVHGAAGWQASDGPSPILGLRWLMTAAELKAERPGLEEGSHYLSETRELFGRKAHVSYGFWPSSGGLMSVSITFTGASSDAQFDETERVLASAYGPLSPIEPEVARSRSIVQMRRVTQKEWPNVQLRHSIGSGGASETEWVMMLTPTSPTYTEVVD